MYILILNYTQMFTTYRFSHLFQFYWIRNYKKSFIIYLVADNAHDGAILLVVFAIMWNGNGSFCDDSVTMRN